MTIHDNGDIIRAVGYVAIYGAYLEDRISHLLDFTDKNISEIKNKNATVSNQLKYINKSLLTLFNKVKPYQNREKDIEKIKHILKIVQATIKDRNNIIHSVLISNTSGIITQKNKRKNFSMQINSKEVIKCANYIFDLQSEIWALKYPIQRLLNNIK